MGDVGWQELLLIAVVILVLFGANKIPEFMKGLGKGIGEFNKAKDGFAKEFEEGRRGTSTHTEPQRLIAETPKVNAEVPKSAEETPAVTETSSEVTEQAKESTAL